MAIQYEHLLLVSPVDYLQILSIEMKLTLNNHGYLMIKLRLDIENKSVERITSDDEITLINKSNDKVIFSGYIGKADIKIHNDFKEVMLSVVTGSKRLDYEKKVRTFQGMTFNEILTSIFNEYDSTPYIDIIDNESKFMVQYYETDFEFIKRLASQKSLVVMPHVLDNKTKLYIDIKKKNNDLILETLDFNRYEYSETKNSYEDSYYVISDLNELTLGDMIYCNGYNLFVREVEGWLKDGMMLFTYKASVKYYIRNKPYIHPHFAGIGLYGRVIDVENRKVKVHFDVDTKQDIDKACWIPYGPIGCNAWYTMPKIGTKVLVRFENEEANSAVGIGVIREGNDEKALMESSMDKSFTTEHGHYLGFLPDAIEFSTDLTSIRLDDGIIVESNDTLTISSDSVLNIGEIKTKAYDANLNPIDIIKTSKAINLRASELLSMVVTNKGSGMEMDGEIRFVSLSNTNASGSEKIVYEPIIIDNDLSALNSNVTTPSTVDLKLISEKEIHIEKEEESFEKMKVETKEKSDFMSFIEDCGKVIVKAIEVVTSSIPVIVSGLIYPQPSKRLALEMASGVIANVVSTEIIDLESSTSDNKKPLNPLLENTFVNTALNNTKEQVRDVNETIQYGMSKLNVFTRQGLNLMEDITRDISEQLKSEMANLSEIKWGDVLYRSNILIMPQENTTILKNKKLPIVTENGALKGSAPNQDSNLEGKKIPAIYKECIQALQEKYPKWKFTFYDVDVTIDEFIDAQYNHNSPCPKSDMNEFMEKNREIIDKRIDKISKGLKKSKTSSEIEEKYLVDGNFYLSTRKGVEFFVTPKHFLNDEKVGCGSKDGLSYDDYGIYQFMDLSFNSDSQTIEGIRNLFKGTYFEKKDLANEFFNAAKKYNINAFSLASKSIVEGGAGQIPPSKLIEGYKVKNKNGEMVTVYNFFGIGANDGNAMENAVNKALKKEWTSEKLAIEAGAELLSEGYVSEGQDTYYTIRYNLNGYLEDNKRTVGHQYASNIADAWVKGWQFSKLQNTLKDVPLVFKIPVYKKEKLNEIIGGAEELRKEVVDEALKWKGRLPYCINSVVLMRKLDINNPPPYMDCADFSSSVYYTLFDIKIGLNCTEQLKSGLEIDTSSIREGNFKVLKKGDLIYFDWKSANTKQWDGNPNHVGIYIGEGKYIHESGHNSDPNNLTDPKQNVKITSLSDNWGGRYGFIYSNVFWVRRIIQDDGELLV